MRVVNSFIILKLLLGNLHAFRFLFPVLASVVVAAADGGEMAADVDVPTSASHMRITLTLLTPTGILLRMSGIASDLCACMTYSYETAVVVAAEEATRGIRVTIGATRIEPPAVYLQQ